MDYSDCQALTVVIQDGIALVTMLFQSDAADPPGRVQHLELANIWRKLDRDPLVKTVVITGVGDEFYLTGRPAPAPTRTQADLREWAAYMEREVSPFVHEMIMFGKPVIAAINGNTSGAGLTVAMLADISIMAEEAWLVDPHIMLGLSAGDGAGAIWPLFTGLAKAKLYLMTSDAIIGREADRIGLIGRAVPHADVMEIAMDYARRLVSVPEVALRYTKRGLNQWLRQAELVVQDHALMLEALSVLADDRTNAPYVQWPPRQIP